MSIRMLCTSLLLVSCGGHAAPSPGAVARDADAASAPTSAASSAVPVNLTIERIDDVRWIVDDAVIASVSAEALLGELTVDVRDGRHILARVPRATWFDALDLRAGDQIEWLGGAGALVGQSLRAAAAAVADRHEIQLSIRRDGRSMRHRYVLASSPLAMTVGSHRPQATPEERAIAAAIRPGVRKTGEATYEIDRAVMSALRPIMVGASAYGSRPDDNPITAGLGLTRYDEIRTVGDRAVHSAQELVGALQDVAGQPEIALVVVRLDEPVTLRYRIVNGRVDVAALAAAIQAWDKAESERSAMIGQVLDGPGQATPADATPIDFSTMVRRIDDYTFEIDATRITAVLADPAQIARGVRIVPSVKNGQPDGLKLYAIRPSSLYAALGLMNGDTVHAIDGRSVAGADAALRAYADLRRKVDSRKSITIELSITRRGKPVLLTYRTKKK